MADKSKFHYLNFLSPPTTEISHFLAEDNQLVICDGVNPSYKLGSLVKDSGYTKIGAGQLEAGKSILGLHNFRQSASVQKLLATVDNAAGTGTQMFYSTGGNWTELTDAETAWVAEANRSIEMEDFIGYCFFVGFNFTAGGWTSPRSLTGTTFGTTNTTSMPNAKYIKRYRDRLYIANCYNAATQPYRVYFSSVPSAGAITWTPASDFLDVDYSEEITGLGVNFDRLMIFTKTSTYLYNQDELKKSWDIGCINHRTICNLDASIIWVDNNNVWASTSGGRPEPIGNNIMELLKSSVASGNTPHACVTDREYHLYLGTAVSANGITYTNCVATWNAATNMWRWREYADIPSIFATFYTSGQFMQVFGTSTGYVMSKYKMTDALTGTNRNSDNGSPISAWFRTKAYDFGDPTIQKNISKIIAYCENGIGLDFRFRVFNKNNESLSNFTHIMNLEKVINIKDRDLDGHFIQFEGKDYSTKYPFIFHGFSVLLDPFDRAK